VKRYTFHLIPHTHWDREWYLPRAAFVSRLVPALDDLIARLEAESCFRSFLLDGQTVLLEDYLRLRSERADSVRGLVGNGRLQVGPWYVLADELIPSGESLVRNLLEGTADAERLGRRSDVLYSPDAFGHPAAWPTLARQFGIRFGALWRGLGGERAGGGDLFRWFGPDGSAVLLYHFPPQGYEAGMDLPADPDQLPSAWAPLREELVERAATSHIAVFIGADHHAAHPGLCRLRDLLAALEPECEVRISRLDEFFADASGESALVPALRGELRWSYGYTWTLQGVHGTRSALKRRHAEAELWLERIAEPLAALAHARGLLQSGNVLRDAWRTLLRSQFHDSIGGCTSDAVARRVETRIADAEIVAREVARRSLDALVGNDPDHARDDPTKTAPVLVLWNGVPRTRRGMIVADLTSFRGDVLVGPTGSRRPRRAKSERPVALSGPDGVIPLQTLGSILAHERLDSLRHYPDQDEVEVTRVAFHAPELPGFGLTALAPVGTTSGRLRGAARVRRERLDNGLIGVSVLPDSTVQLEDKVTGERFNGLFRFESAGDVGDTYTYAPPTRDRVVRLAGPVRTRVIAEGPLVAALELTGRIPLETGEVSIKSILSIRDGSRALHVTVEIHNRASDHRLRLACPTGVGGGSAIAGAPFGLVERESVSLAGLECVVETPVATAPAHRFVAHASPARGLALFAPGFFEYELTPAGELLVTLLRAIGQLSRADLSTRPGHAGWPAATPEAQEHGVHRWQLAVWPVRSSDISDGTALPRMWEDLFLPPRAIWLRQSTELRPAFLDCALDGEGIVFSALKPAEDGEGVVLRCYNAGGSPTTGACRAPFDLASAARTRADERDAVPLPVEDRRTVRFTAGGHELVTLLLTPALPSATAKD
jgi:mannosylglycerate hydrolase